MFLLQLCDKVRNKPVLLFSGGKKKKHIKIVTGIIVVSFNAFLIMLKFFAGLHGNALCKNLFL